MIPEPLSGSGELQRLVGAALLALCTHLGLAHLPLNWRPPASPPATVIRIKLMAPEPAPSVPAPAATPAATVAAAPSPPAAPPQPVKTPEPRPMPPSTPASKPPPSKPRPVVKARPPQPLPPERLAQTKLIPPAPKPVQPRPSRRAAPPPEASPAPGPHLEPRSLSAATATAPVAASSSNAGAGTGTATGANLPAGNSTSGTGTVGAGAAAVPVSALYPLPGNPPPRYPPLARERGYEGRVLLRLTVNPAGQVETVSVAHSSGHEMLDEEARRTVARWRFRPPAAERLAVAQVPIVFRLHD